MAHTASNSNYSPVSCLNLQAFRRFFPFSFYFSPYSLSPLSQQANEANQKTTPTTRSSPCGFSRGKDFPGFSCLHLLRTSGYLITQTYIGVLLHSPRPPIFGFFFLFAENANKRKTRFSTEGTSLLQYEDINWNDWIPHAVVSKVFWQLTEHLESQDLGFVWRNFPTRVMSKGRWMCGEGEGSWGGGQKEKRKERHWWGRKWEITSVSSLDLLPFLLASGWLQPTQGASWVHSWGLWRLLFCLHFHWTSPLCIFIITYLVPHGTLNVHQSLRNEGCLLGIGPAYSSLWERISQVRSQSLQNIPQWSTSGSPWA